MYIKHALEYTHCTQCTEVHSHGQKVFTQLDCSCNKDLTIVTKIELWIYFSGKKAPYNYNQSLHIILKTVVLKLLTSLGAVC